ncbi:MAG: protein translocase subunit SecF [Chloroflexi bacterium]|nr:protein translocase subunit SecF [Chloroflexota bacterium]
MFDIIGKRFWFFLISGIVILAGIVALIVFGLKPGIEFTSGSLLTVKFDQPVTVTQLKQASSELGYSDTIIQHTGEGNFLIRLPELTSVAKTALQTGLADKLGKAEVIGFDSISPLVAAETTRNAIIAVIISAIGMLIYISWAFHRVPNPFRWGTCAIIALVHDILVVIGTFALLGGIADWQIDLMFITGMLTVIGYSINDTIVIFDRIRENLLKSGQADFETVVNNSLVETMSRTLNTSLTTLFGIIALWRFVGAPIQNLVIVLLVGIITGTYSSFGTAASLLVVWKKGEWGRFLMRRTPATAKS